MQGLLKIMQDKTERRQIEEALRQSENRYRTIADAVPQLMWSNTADGRLEFCNQHWQNYTGMMPEFPLSELVLELFHPEDLPAVVATRNCKRFKQGNPTNLNVGCAGLTVPTAGI